MERNCLSEICLQLRDKALLQNGGKVRAAGGLIALAHHAAVNSQLRTPTPSHELCPVFNNLQHRVILL
jgi:hypothetical protein